ncbi:MAG: hypothetical protein ACRC1K_12760, partial [Planctomycetia bacterium]
MNLGSLIVKLETDSTSYEQGIAKATVWSKRYAESGVAASASAAALAKTQTAAAGAAGVGAAANTANSLATLNYLTAANTAATAVGALNDVVGRQTDIQKGAEKAISSSVGTMASLADASGLVAGAFDKVEQAAGDVAGRLQQVESKADKVG